MSCSAKPNLLQKLCVARDTLLRRLDALQAHHIALYLFIHSFNTLLIRVPAIVVGVGNTKVSKMDRFFPSKSIHTSPACQLQREPKTLTGGLLIDTVKI